MILDESFEITEVAGEYLLIAIGDVASSFNGIVTLNEPAAFILNHMHTPKTIEELVSLLTQTYDVSTDIAKRDIEELIKKLGVLGVIKD